MKKSRSLLSSIIAFLVSLAVIAPFALIILNSFKNKKEAAEMNISLPTQWNIVENYKEVFDTGLPRAFVNSCIVTILSVALIIMLSSLAAFILQRRGTKLTKRLTTLFIVGLVIPGQMIPTYIICNYLHLTSYIGCALVITAANLPLGIFMYLGYLKSIPREIDEAAIIDGCGTLSLFRRVVFPLLKPMTMTLFVLTFMSIWNDFGTTIYFLNSPKNYTLTLTIYNFFGTHASDWNLVFADVVCVSLPVIILFFCQQKNIMSGMTSGAVKG
jgi:raffinose/stachyose/melibiose transport system permease protein